MMTRPAMNDQYSRVAIMFHWTIALLVIVNLAVGILHDPVPALRGWMPGHKSIGILVLVLSLARVAWRLAHRPPPLPPGTPRWEKTAAHGAHWALYALLVLMPLSGWAMVSGTDKRRPLDFFGMFDIPYLPVSKAIGGIGHEAHEVLGWTMVVLVTVHIGAALRHHLILRDSVLARMVPALRH